MLHGNVRLVVFAAILPDDLAREVLLTKHLIEQGLQVCSFVFVDAGDEYSIWFKKLTSQLKAGIDHGAPVGVKATVRLGIRLPGQSSLLAVVGDGLAKGILVHEIATRVIGRVDIDHLDLAVVTTLQELQHLEVVALDIDVVRIERAVLAITAAALLGARAKRGGAYGLGLADGIGLAGPREGVALLALVDLAAKLQPQFVEVDSAFSE